MSTISTHILDTSKGRPADGVNVILELQNADETWTTLSEAWTDDDGRVKPFFLVETHLDAGTYRLVFDVEGYYSRLDTESFYPQVTIVFRIDDSQQHYHVPLLISPFGFSTYRGS
jgi:5-hydroxyisourate hydrolase